MSNYNKSKDRNKKGKIDRKYTRNNGKPLGTPKWWLKCFMTRPKRCINKRSCHAILRGADPDALNFPVKNRKPHLYYW